VFLRARLVSGRIAAGADYSAGHIYNFLPSKEAVYAAVADEYSRVPIACDTNRYDGTGTRVTPTFEWYGDIRDSNASRSAPVTRAQVSWEMARAEMLAADVYRQPIRSVGHR
jgi:AcrR family transcriptional regulator